MTARGREVHVERLLGRQVHAPNGHQVGHIEELRVEKRGMGYVVTDFVLGPAGLLERMSVSVGRAFFGRRHKPQVARWDQMDLSDPDHPRLTCNMEDLREE